MPRTSTSCVLAIALATLALMTSVALPATPAGARVHVTEGEKAADAARATQLRDRIDEILAGLPNLPADEVPDGPDETANRVLRHHGDEGP